jgi:hypothetical protein
MKAKPHIAAPIGKRHRPKAIVIRKAAGTPIEQPSAVETIADTPAQLALTALAAYSGGWMAALLPVLSNTLAQGRARKRVEAALNDVNDRLAAMADRLQDLSDAQYTAIGRVVSTMFETVDEEKLRLLKAAVLNIAGSDFLNGFEAQAIARIIRDISAAEVRFLAQHRVISWISFGKPEGAGPFQTLENPPPLFVDKMSAEGSVVIGLINLGLIVRSTSEGLMSDTGAYVYSPLVEKLLQVLNEQ